MRSREIYVPLFTELSTCVDSPFFHVFPGQIAILQGFGFSDYAYRANKATMQQAQMAFVEMLLFKETFGPMVHCSADQPLMDLRQFQSELLARECMRMNGCAFALSKVNNIMFLHIPGSYCLVMNDPCAVGNARVYLRIMTKDEFPWGSQFFIGE